jgi:acyl-CoA thioester hydrolase
MPSPPTDPPENPVVGASLDASLRGWKRIVELDVLFRDTDLFGHVNHAVFVTWMEAARVQWWARRTGSATFDRWPFFLGEQQIRYTSAVRFGERIGVDAALTAVSRRTFRLEYRIVETTTGRLCARAWSVQVMAHPPAGPSYDIPDELRPMLESLRVDADALGEG